jgi:hypothetical protein
MSSDSYVKAALDNTETWLSKQANGTFGKALKTKVSSMLPSGYKPELDVSDELDDDMTSYYQQQIGVLRWMVELGRGDIAQEVSSLAAYCALPREGHLGAIFHLYAYLKKYPRSKMVFDPTKMDWDAHPDCDWSDFYPIDKTVLDIPGMPKPLGDSIQTTCFVDSDHAGDVATRRSRTGVLIFCNRAPIVIYSKKQGSIETASFGSELSAMKTATELVGGLRYKIQMMGCPLDGATYMKCDNMSVVHNCSNPASQLKKKSNSIAYHYVRERCAFGDLSVSYHPTESNPSDSLTKTQAVVVRQNLCSQFLY